MASSSKTTLDSLNATNTSLLTLLKLKELRNLYVERMCGVRFVEQQIANVANASFVPQSQVLNDTIKHCHLCARHKTSSPSLGYLSNEALLIFIVETPLGDGEKLKDSKSATMLKNIANNVFFQEQFCVLSLLKCGEDEASEEQINTCKPYLLAQLEALNGGYVVMFGDKVLESLLGIDFSHKGVLLDVGNKKAIATYAPTQLLKNPILKKEAWQHLCILEKFMKSKI